MNKTDKNLEFNTLIKYLESDEKTFMHLLPESLRLKVLSLPENYVNVTEEQLLENIDLNPKAKRFEVLPTIEALRNNFWIEYDRAAASVRGSEMILRNIWQGVAYENVFEKCSQETLAYIICRPPEYEAVMAGMLSLSTRRLRDILSIPIYKSDGTLNDAKHIELVLKAAAMVDLRNKGSYVSRVETKNMTMIDQRTTNVSHVFNDKFATDKDALTSQSIDERLEMLEKQLKNLPEPPSPKIKETHEEVEIVE